ncbi:hypothetical protein OUZ56_030167 [Daphnia magna]|uniref:DUF4806 domain-containing protein n=1 Tax=Daphnia magna TaxID=35525 RepID=A0ABQ9ZQG8_9CRUS|nr:hypothetical protein OUZ56_030167 [Daphnia magna]
MAEHKLMLVDLLMDEETDMVIVSETWAVDDDEIYYPPHEVKGAKLQKYCRLHMQPDPTSWRRYPFRLIRMCENWAVAKSYEVRLAKNPDSELNTDAGGPLGQRKRKVPERYSPPPASGIPLKKSANNVLQRRLSKTWSNESDDPPYPSVADASEKIPVTASSNKPVPESQIDMFEILSDDSGNKSPVLNSSSHSKAMVPVKQTSMAADCGSSTMKSVVGKTVTSKPSTTLESKLLFTCVRSFPEKKMAPFISSKKAGLVSSPDVASKKRVYPLSNLQIENGSHGLKRTTTLVNASKGNSLKNSKESRKYEDAVVARSVSPIRPFQLAIKENVSYKSPVAVNTMVNKQKSIKYLIKKPETAVTKSFSLPTPELRHKDGKLFCKGAKPTDDKISEVTLRKVINIERMMQEFLVNQGPILAFIERTNSVVTERDLFPFPVDDEKNFALFLVLLESPEDVAKLMTGRLSSLGGNNLDDRICNIWAAIITDKWGMSLSWAGRDASKYAVKNTKLFHFIYDLVRSSISYTNAEQSAVEETSKNWIYKAGRRYLRAQATAEKRTRLDDEEDPREGMSSAEIGAIDGYYEKEMDLEDGKQESQISSDEEQNDSESSQSIGS